MEWSAERRQLVTLLATYGWLPECGGHRCSSDELVHYSQGLRRSLERRRAREASSADSGSGDEDGGEEMREHSPAHPLPRDAAAPTKPGRGGAACEQRFPFVGRHAPSLLGLPVDVLANVLGRLRARGVCRVAGTCSSLRASVNESGLWRLLYLSHSDLVSGNIHRLQMPPSSWRALCISLAHDHLAKKRARRRSATTPSKKRPPPPPTAWRCPADGCGKEFPLQWRLLGHLPKHFAVGASEQRFYCSHLLCARFFPDAHRQVPLN
ncbi:hypothetical protein T484DRAFT_1824551 [Baffinella frigidus]|nr:hypothetical protein T484DRAFT_1824551 [Cryptophyta sp. CCMP2293]